MALKYHFNFTFTIIVPLIVTVALKLHVRTKLYLWVHYLLKPYPSHHLKYTMTVLECGIANKAMFNLFSS